jgi:hypothetical protein
MDDARQGWAAAIGYRSQVEAVSAAERDKSEIRRKRPHHETSRAAAHVFDRIVTLTEAFEPLRNSAAAWPNWPPGQAPRQESMLHRPAQVSLGLVNGSGPAASDLSRARRATPRGKHVPETSAPARGRQLRPRRASPLTAFITTFVIALPVVFVVALLLPPAAPYPEWGMKALADLTFAGAVTPGDAASVPGLVQYKRAHAAAGPRLAVAHRIAARVDEAVPFPIAVQGIEALGEGSGVIVRGLPEHAGLSHGEQLEPGAWRVDVWSAANLALTLRRRIESPQAISVELLAPDGEVVLAAASTTLVVEPAPPGG